MTNSATEKPVVSSFTNYPTPPPPPEPVQIPATYLQPWATVGSYFPFSGVVYDQNNIPVENAIVIGWNNWNQTPDVPLNLYALTNKEGEFTMSVPVNNPELKINHIKITAIAASVSDNIINESPPSTFYIIKNYSGYITNLSNLYIPIGSVQSFEAINTLSLTNVTVAGNGTTGGVADFSARENVNVHAEFNAETGSEVHIFNQIIAHECEIIPFKQSEGYTQQPPIDKNNQVRNVDLLFEQQGSIFRISPNPSHGIIAIDMSIGSGSYTGYYKIKIINCTGSEVAQYSNQTFPLTLDISFLTPGVYFLRICGEDNQVTDIEKLILE